MDVVVKPWGNHVVASGEKAIGTHEFPVESASVCRDLKLGRCCSTRQTKVYRGSRRFPQLISTLYSDFEHFEQLSLKTTNASAVSSLQIVFKIWVQSRNKLQESPVTSTLDEAFHVSV
jgi:hypothetical protein